MNTDTNRRPLGGRLPVILQTEITECGLACLAMIAVYHGHRVDLAALRRRFEISLRGASVSRLIAIAQDLGLDGRGLRVELHALRNLQTPSILHWDLSHFVVLKQVRGDLVELGDPILGNRVVPLPEFLEAWPSRAVFVVIGTDFDRNTVLLQPSTRPSARALYARQGPITDAELLDFGFTHADLF
jgi:hypothetical protein